MSEKWSQAARGFGGDLSDFPLTSVLQMLELGRKTGFLYIRSFPRVAFLVFREGGIVQAVSSMRRVGIGELLISHGVIQRKHLDLALETQRLSSEKKMLGAIFKDLGYVTHDQIIEVLSKQMKQIVRWVLKWERGAFTYYPEQAEKLEISSEEEEVMLPMGIVVEEMLTEMLSDQDRRKWPRVPISLKVVWAPNGEPQNLFTHNVSGGGLYVLADDLPQKDDQLDMEVWIPTLFDPTPISGKVVRVNESGRGEGKGFAIEFIKIAEEARLILEGLGRSLSNVF